MEKTVEDKLLAIEANLKEHRFPPQLVVENTSACDQQCVHCSHKELIRPKKHMRRELWNKIVEEVARESPDTEIWPTFYGEALVMGGEIWDRIDYAAKVGCTNLVLNSNGGLLSGKNHIDRILASPLKRFILSIDGFTPETYEKIRFRGKWDVTYPGVEELLRRKAASGQTYPAIICQFSLMEENEHEVEDFRHYWQERGAEVKVRPKLEWTATGSIRSDRIDHETEFRIACPWGNNTMAIHQDGSVVACAVDYEGRFKAGNASEKSLLELWSALGERLRKVHRCHRWGELPDVCKGCRDWQTAGAEYERKNMPGTRPFWYDPETTDFKVTPIHVQSVAKETQSV
ncbi:MAG: SPASM domain-containing protein [Rhodocyclaceae bacterium]|nr:SPASM domain-containing protein [Rhodocyclaceae bacterium]